jgi:tRNA(fMet)-specific endonuclease VapC
MSPSIWFPRDGAARQGARREENKKRLAQFLEPFKIVPFDDTATAAYAVIRLQTQTEGRPIGPNDLLIEATAISHKGVLAINNVKTFSQVRQLPVENWILE